MKEILCFGDSNTYGLVPRENRRFSYDERWTGILSSVLGEAFHVTEEGLCGRTTVFEDSCRYGRKSSETLPLVLESHSDVDLIVLMLGTNDLKSGFRSNEKVIALGIEHLIKQIKSFNENIKILLVSPIHLGERVWENDYDPEFDSHSVEVSRNLKKEYSRVAEKFGVQFFAASDYVSPSETDQEHLDLEGHKKFAQAVYYNIIRNYAA